MKKLTLSLLSVVGVTALTGCAMTDYCSGPDCTQAMLENNLSHSAAGCFEEAAGVNVNQPVIGHPASNIPGPTSNTQQTIEPYNDNVLERALPQTIQGFPIPCSSACSFTSPNGACPGAIPGGTTNEEAREWQRFIGTYAFTIEAQVLFPGSPQFQGFWALGATKALDSDCNADGFGDVRINTWFCNIQGFGPFTCPTNTSGTSHVNYGGPEVQLLGHQVQNNLPQCSQPWNIETVSVDTRAGAQFSTNIMALTPDRNAPGNGYSTFLGVLGRIGEGKLDFVNIKPGRPAAGLAEFFSGESMTINVPALDLRVTASGALRSDGMMDISVESLRYQDKEFTASAPLTFTVDRDLKLYKYDNTNQETQLRELATWAVQNLDLSKPFDLSGVVVPEFGLTLRPMTIQLNTAAMQAYVNGSSNLGIGGGPSGRNR